MKKLDFIYNPLAGGKRTAKAKSILEKELTEKGIPFTMQPTCGPKNGIKLARRLSDCGATDIIAVGGDGTMNEVLNGLDPKISNFGLIPTGTGNDFAACGKIPLNVKDALNLILNGEPKKTDYMDCSGVRGINIIGTGIDVDILKRCAASKILKGKMQYFLSLLVSMFKYKACEFDIIKNGERIKKDAFIVCIANGSQLGGGIKMCPDATIDDGALDFVLVRGMKRSKLLGALTKLVSGKILSYKRTEYERLSELTIDLPRDTTIQIDGELYYGLPFDVKLVSGGINMYR